MVKESRFRRYADKDKENSTATTAVENHPTVSKLDLLC